MNEIYHQGEMAVQRRAGVAEMASRVGRSIRRQMPPLAKEFLSDQPFAVLSSVGKNGDVWVSLLAGKPGFMRAIDDETIEIETLPHAGDPLGENLKNNRQIGMIAIEFATRRRMRVNGLAEIAEKSLFIRTEQVYSNCPKYIQARTWKELSKETSTSEILRADELNDSQRKWIENADTFFIGSYDNRGGADASHRGGNPGFVRFSSPSVLAFPDYSGNMMFNTLGNLAANPKCGLLFIDFERGNTLQLTGSAEIIWNDEKIKEFAGAERVVEFRIEEAIEISGRNEISWQFVDFSPFNPQ